ncbi:MAG: hypothetical protein GKR89_16430 [Candidatus Latescibacteria bacterium]|nr:hypothetical protein [Candidatus Latescibacterota bacterium]
MHVMRRIWPLAVGLAVGLVGLTGCGDETVDEGTVLVEAAPELDPAAARLARLSELDVPPDGQELGDFLLREIPDVIGEVPCVCCNKTLNECYTGDCPPM